MKRRACPHELTNEHGTIMQAPAEGLSLTVIAYYADQPGIDGIATYQVARDLVKVK